MPRRLQTWRDRSYVVGVRRLTDCCMRRGRDFPTHFELAEFFDRKYKITSKFPFCLFLSWKAAFCSLKGLSGTVNLRAWWVFGDFIFSLIEKFGQNPVDWALNRFQRTKPRLCRFIWNFHVKSIFSTFKFLENCIFRKRCIDSIKATESSYCRMITLKGSKNLFFLYGTF